MTEGVELPDWFLALCFSGLNLSSIVGAHA